MWRMFLDDPLSPVRSYVHQFAMTGVGLFLEGMYGQGPAHHEGLCQAAFSVSGWHCPVALSCCNESLFQAWDLASFLTCRLRHLLHQQQLHPVQAVLQEVLEHFPDVQSGQWPVKSQAAMEESKAES